MRALLLASTLMILPMTSHAQVSVDSVTADLAAAKAALLEAKAFVVQNTQVLHEAATDLQTAQIYAQEVEMYVHMIENPTLLVTTILNQTGLNSDLPINPTQIMTLANGFHATQGGSLMGDLAQLRMLSSFASGAFQENHVYTCAGTDPTCNDLNARANGIAASMGLAQAAYNDIQTHQTILQTLRDDLAGTTDPAKRETITAHTAIEQAYVQNASGRLQAAMQQSALAEQSAKQRMLERQRQSADSLFANTQPITSTSVAAAGDQSSTAPRLFTAY